LAVGNWRALPVARLLRQRCSIFILARLSLCFSYISGRVKALADEGL